MALMVLQGDGDPRWHNYFLLLDPKGTVALRYHKAIPVPGWEAQHTVPGNTPLAVVDTPHGRIGAAICFDMDFPAVARQAGRLGADILLVPASDWRSIDPWHTHMARYRGVEQGFAVVRQANQGLSAAFDHQGRAPLRARRASRTSSV